ncbi:MAG: hypothetical protein MUE85_03315 [Microscillaceae bacterium]|nr:hypothetical protein [Microscillaceae bacterium]
MMFLCQKTLAKSQLYDFVLKFGRDFRLSCIEPRLRARACLPSEGFANPSLGRQARARKRGLYLTASIRRASKKIQIRQTITY